MDPEHIRLIHIGLQRILTKAIADKLMGHSSYTCRGLILLPFARIISNGPKSMGPKPIAWWIFMYRLINVWRG